MFDAFAPSAPPAETSRRAPADLDLSLNPALRQTAAATAAREGGRAPADVAIGSKAIRIWLDMPGVSPGSVSVRMIDGALCVTGRRAAARLSEEEELLVGERAVEITRRVRLPAGLKAGAVDMHMADGVLMLTIARAGR